VRPERDADHSSPYSAEVKNELELYLRSPLSRLWRYRGSFTLIFYLLFERYESCNLGIISRFTFGVLTL
jgi:hypothetical protein